MDALLLIGNLFCFAFTWVINGGWWHMLFNILLMTMAFKVLRKRDTQDSFLMSLGLQVYTIIILFFFSLVFLFFCLSSCDTSPVEIPMGIYNFVLSLNIKLVECMALGFLFSIIQTFALILSSKRSLLDVGIIWTSNLLAACLTYITLSFYGFPGSTCMKIFLQ